jgi:hypothetical protein
VRRAPSQSRQRPGGRGVGYSYEFLERLARILVHTGHSPRKLTREFRAICGRLKEPRQAWDPAYLNYLADLPHVVARWHADPQFVDSRGHPIALPLRSRGLSLSALISRVLPGEDRRAVVQSLIRLRAIRRQGARYLPTDRQLRLRQQSGRVHGLMTLLGILRTVQYNLSRASRSSTILERAAINPRFPERHLPAFHRWVKSHGGKFLWDADGKMRRREAREPGEPATRLGVAVFVFEDPPVTGTRRAREPSRAGRRRRMDRRPRTRRAGRR